MAKYKPQHSRLLFIDRRLSEGRYPNCRTLAEEWEVSRKTIQRDLDYMRYQLEAPIEYSSDNRGYYYTEQNFKLPAISIKESDLFAIYLAEKVLEQYEGTPLYDNLCTVFKKIEDSLPKKLAGGSVNDFSRFSFLCSSTTLVYPEVWDTVFSCLRSLNSLEWSTSPEKVWHRFRAGLTRTMGSVSTATGMLSDSATSERKSELSASHEWSMPGNLMHDSQSRPISISANSPAVISVSTGLIMKFVYGSSFNL